jgi:putative DNA primase/helicase
MTAADFAKLVNGARRRADGTWWDSHCPAHDDQRASLSFTDGDHALVVHCQARCTRDAIAAALGQDVRQFSHHTNGHQESARIVATYDYRDTDGTLRFQVCRMDPKTFRQRRPDGNGGWIWNMKGVERVPYRLEALMREHPATVCVAEGERDVETLEHYGLPATTNVGGAGKWRASDAAALVTAGVASVVVFRDNDTAGVEQETLVARTCHAVGLEVKLARLPGLPPVRDKHGEDVTDWMASHSADELRGVVTAAEPWSPTAPDRPAIASTRAAAPTEAPHPTDQGNGRRFAREHVGRVRYAWGERRYLWWDGRRFSRHDAEGHALELAKGTARGIYAEADRETDPDRRKRLATWAARSESEARLRAMLALAASEPGMAVAPHELDADGDLLNVENGLVDTRLGTLGPHDPAKLCTKLAPVVYDPAARCPRFMTVLDTIFAGRTPLIEFMQRALGYALTADVSEQCLFVLYGKGANGKSTLLRVVGDLLGDYARTTPTETLLVQRGEGPRNDVMRLRGARFVSANEAEGRRHLSESLVKALTGSDVIAARALYQEFDQFVPTFKVFLSVNHHPRITGTDRAIWRRIRLIPFDVTIPEAEQDKHLGDALRAEWPGIFAWLVRGTLAWRRDGLRAPKDITEATADYRRGQDTLGPFLDEACVCTDGASVAIGDLYSRYVAWAETNREPTLSKREFGVRMLERDGVTRDRTGTARLWRGVRLRLDTEAPAPAGTVEAATPW